MGVAMRPREVALEPEPVLLMEKGLLGPVAATDQPVMSNRGRRSDGSIGCYRAAQRVAVLKRPRSSRSRR